MSNVLWTYSKGTVQLSFPDGTHSPRFKSDEHWDADSKANNWLQQKEKDSE